jgi:hypothetical protein
MEALLRLSGLLSEEDADATDLQTLEQRLAEKKAQMNGDKGDSASHTPTTSMSGASPNPASDASKEPEKSSTDKTSQSKPKGKGKDEEVEALSEAMCSLVTNNYGDTRYIGRFCGRFKSLGTD